jgi:DNA repair exonuclease SbcCD ATPase subunit
MSSQKEEKKAMSSKHDTYLEFIHELVEEIADSKGTLSDKLDKLGNLEEIIEDMCDKSIQYIHGKLHDLEKLACPNCEGLGEFKYREYFEVCKQCKGGGYV